MRSWVFHLETIPNSFYQVLMSMNSKIAFYTLSFSSLSLKRFTRWHQKHLVLSETLRSANLDCVNFPCRLKWKKRVIHGKISSSFCTKKIVLYLKLPCNMKSRSFLIKYNICHQHNCFKLDNKMCLKLSSRFRWTFNCL